MSLLSAFLVASTLVVQSSPSYVLPPIREGIRSFDELPKLTEMARRGTSVLRSFGSGVLIQSNGYFGSTNHYLLTNHHVIDDAKEIVVVVQGSAYFAAICAKNKKKDLALLKFYARKDYPFLFVPRNETLQVGQTIYAMGYPLSDIKEGLDPQVTRGIVSNLHGRKGYEGEFQMDVAITHGNSGGPVVDEFGRLVGISVRGTAGWQSGNYAVNMSSIESFLANNLAELRTAKRPRTIRPQQDMIAEVAKSVVLVLNYGVNNGAAECVTAENDTEKREIAALINKRILAARLFMLKGEWAKLKEVSDALLAQVGENEEMLKMNNLAREHLGLHLIIYAEVNGRDVRAEVKPICGITNEYVECETPIPVFCKGKDRGFPVRAKLEYSEGASRWKGELDLIYNWRGTKEVRVQLAK